MCESNRFIYPHESTFVRISQNLSNNQQRFAKELIVIAMRLIRSCSQCSYINTIILVLVIMILVNGCRDDILRKCHTSHPIQSHMIQDVNLLTTFLFLPQASYGQQLLSKIFLSYATISCQVQHLHHRLDNNNNNYYYWCELCNNQFINTFTPFLEDNLR